MENLPIGLLHLIGEYNGIVFLTDPDILAVEYEWLLFRGIEFNTA